MKNLKSSPFLLNLLLVCSVGLYCLVETVYRAVLPQVIFPRFDLPVMVALSVLALVVEAYLVRGWAGRNWVITICLGFLTFLVLPLCAGVVEGATALKTGLAGGAAFALTALCYTGILERIRSGGKAPLAPLGSGLALVLAAQILSGLL